MVLLDESLVFLISQTARNFGIDSDKASFVRIEDNLSSIQKARKKALDQSHEALLSLSRALELSRTSANTALTDPTHKDHGTTMITLDREKFSLAKSINDLESTTHTLESQLARLRDESDAIDSEDVGASAQAVSEDETLLKLRVYRGLGIEILESPTGGEGGGTAGSKAGAGWKVAIRNPGRDMHMVTIEPKYSRYFYANYLWNAL